MKRAIDLRFSPLERGDETASIQTATVLSSLSDGGNHRSIALSFEKLFKKQPLFFCFEMSNNFYWFFSRCHQMRINCLTKFSDCSNEFYKMQNETLQTLKKITDTRSSSTLK